MKYIDEYRDKELVGQYLQKIREIVRHRWTIMEVCGGQTHTFLQFGLDEMLPEEITLVHGPGCPVCVTPLELLDKAVEIALRPNVILCSFGDMLRVPGSQMSLMQARAKGADVRVVYSPLEAVKLARRYPEKEVVFFAVGFETTAPANAMAVWKASQEGLHNFSLLVSHVRVPPAMELILSSPESRVDAFLAAGHVCTVMGYREYEAIAEKYRVPIVVTGFEPADLVQGTYMAVKQLEEGRAEVENQYTRSVRRDGNIPAQKLMEQVFEICDRKWRGIGNIAKSGLKLKPEFARFDAEKRFAVDKYLQKESALCIAGLVLQGIKKPPECVAFGKECTPEHPLGAPMVSAEGACSAYYHYGRKG
ncbi:MAG: hydrogenase formation protein HypD [bacterium]